MDINNIEDEIYEFSTLYFKDVHETVEDGIEFISSNDLFQPKINHVITIEYLFTVINHFKNLDYSIMCDTLKKLHTDVEVLHKLYTKKQEFLLDIDDLFKKKFVKKSKIMTTLASEIIKYQKAKNLSYDEESVYKRLIQDYKELKAIYYFHFQNILTDEKRFYLGSMLSILNTKTYYLDELLWLRVPDSDIIMRSLKELKIEDNKINSKIYLKHRLQVIIPYSADYQYLKKCLKVYK